MAKTIIKSMFFERYVSLIKNSWVKLDQTILNEKLYNIENHTSDEVDNLFNFQDIFALESDILREHFITVLFENLLLPVLIGSVVATKRQHQILSLPLCIFLIAHLLNTVKYTPVLNVLFSVIFMPQIREDLVNCIMNAEDAKLTSLIRDIGLYNSEE